jgi:stage III sporulation protein AB
MYLSVMQGIKYILLFAIFGLSTAIGMTIAKSYENRVIELKEFKSMLNAIKAKIKFTYEPLAEIFKQIANKNETNVERIFGQMANQITYYPTRDVWEKCIQEADISINQEDKDILKKLGKLLLFQDQLFTTILRQKKKFFLLYMKGNTQDGTMS